MDRVSCNLRLFADDAVVYGRASSVTDCNSIQDDLDKISSWCEEWQLALNVEKCKVMRMSRKNNPIMFEYSISSELLDAVASFKYLGVTLQCDMKWNEHVRTVVSKNVQMFVKSMGLNYGVISP